MFGCETISNWKIRSDLLWEGSYKGQKMAFVKGKIVQLEPSTKLIYTVSKPTARWKIFPKTMCR